MRIDPSRLSFVHAFKRLRAIRDLPVFFTCTAVLFEFVAPAEARRMSRNVPKMIKKRHKAIRLHDCKVEAVKPRNGQSESSCGQGATSRWR